jgi:hypothetical protein
MTFGAFAASLIHRARFSIYFIKRFGFHRERRSLLMNYLFRRLHGPAADDISLRSAIRWLIAAQDHCAGKGVSTQFSVKRGWDLAYPETTGYIIPTIYIYGELYDEPGCIRRAIAIGNWEVDIQTPSGGVLSDLKSTATRIFNTAQVLLGWCFLYEKTRENRPCPRRLGFVESCRCI